MTEETRRTDRAGRRAKRFLTPLQKYKIFLQLVYQKVTVIVARAGYPVRTTSAAPLRELETEPPLHAQVAAGHVVVER